MAVLFLIILNFFHVLNIFIILIVILYSCNLLSIFVIPVI